MRKVLAFVLVCAAVMVAQVPSVRNFGQVEAGAIYRGAQPTGCGLLELAQFGIRTILDLRDEASVAREALIVESLSMTFENVPLNGLRAPLDSQIAEALRVIETAQRPIFIHCKNGQDRTGTVVACWRIKRGWTNEMALEEAKFYGINPLQFGMRRYIGRYR